LDLDPMACGVRGLRELPPAAGDRPEANEILSPQARRESQLALHAGVLKPAQSNDQCPRGHSARVVMAALRLVPGVPALAVVAKARAFHYGLGFRRHILEHQMGRELILLSGPTFGEVREWNFRPFAGSIA